MNYLLDKKLKRKKTGRIVILAIVLLLAFYFRTGIWRGVSSMAQYISHPFLVLGNSIGNNLHDFNIYLSSKKLVSLENETLKLQLAESEARMANYNSILDENLKIKEILDRKKTKKDFILSGILAKPNRSLYDTLIIDTGTDDGVLVGQKVFAKGDVPIGYVGEVYRGSSKVILYTSPGEKTDVVISGKLSESNVSTLSDGDILMQAIGRGGGNFEMILPRDFVVESGAEAVLPGIIPSVLARVGTIVSDPRDSYQKALLVSPVNLFELKFVEVEK